MVDVLKILAAFVLGYLLGSINTAVIVGKIYGKDIGSHGAFTKALIETWGEGKFTGSYRDLRKQVRGLIAGRYDQDPQLSTMGVGTLALPNERPFSIGV